MRARSTTLAGVHATDSPPTHRPELRTGPSRCRSRPSGAAAERKQINIAPRAINRGNNGRRLQKRGRRAQRQRTSLYILKLGDEGTAMIEKTLDITTKDGEMETFICHPERNGPFPAVFLLMDAHGIREELKDMARRLGTV